jgi:hypothetical protein
MGAIGERGKSGKSGKKRKPSGFVSLLLLLTGCLMLYMSLLNLGNAVRSATADGALGTFTASRLTCVRHPGHETCEWSGTFRPSDGPAELRGVKLYGSGRDTFEPGQKTAALDVGNAGRVYDPSGSNEWIYTALMLIAGHVLLAVVARRHLMPPPRPRRTA